MKTLLKDLQMTCVYLDDILVTGTVLLKNNCTDVLNRLPYASLRPIREIQSFPAPNVEYLGFIVGTEGLKPLSRKFKTVADALNIANKVAKTESILGLVSNYTKFLSNLAIFLT